MKIARGLAALPLIAISAPSAAAGEVNPAGSGPIVSGIQSAAAAG